MYKLFARTAGGAGTVSNSGIYQYSSDIEIINDTVSDSTSTYSSAKIDEKIATYSLNTQDGKQKWLVLNLGGAGQSHPITVSDHYGGEIEIIGMSSKYATNSSYKTVKVIRHSYGDWNLDSATDYTTTTSGDGNYKIRGVYYNPNDNKYYVEIRQYASIKVSGAVVSAPTMVDYSSVAASEMTAIPESQFASKKDIDGTTIKTTTTTGSEYYAITFKDKQFERGNNQGILIQHNRLNFEPVTFIFSASSYGAAVYERDNYDVTKINGSFYNPTSPYMMQFYMDKTNNTLYLSVPSYSGVSLTDLQFKGDAITYTKVSAIPNTATKITVTEYATKADLGESEWTEATLNSYAVAYDDNNKPVYKKVGNAVYLTGIIKPSLDTNSFNTSNGHIIFTLPVGYRPNRQVNVLCQGTMISTWLLTINTNGTVVASRYRQNISTTVEFDAISPPTTTWMPFSISFAL